jgi:hypothetical protein
MHGISVRVSRNTVPAVYGVFAPEIVIPAEALRMLPRDQQLLLAHEREHVHARDPLLLAASAVVVALLPWHPVAWWLASRVRLSVELDCDARVLRAGGSRRVYGDLLLTFAQRTRGAGMPIGVSALFDSRSPLERRLLAMAQRQSPARANVAAAVFVAAAVTLVACTSPVPDAPESEPSALFLAIDSRDLLTGESIFTIDGQPATLSQAYALKRSEVASVFIDRSPNDSTFRRITMKTRPAGSPEPQQLLIAGWDRRISRDSIIAARARRDIDRAR